MSIFLLNDQGNVIFNSSDQKVYSKIGTSTLGIPEAWEAGDVGNITQFQYGPLDPQGRNLYTAEEMAVMENLHFVRKTGSDGVGTWLTVYASSIGGVLRYGERSGGGSAQIRINGVAEGMSYAGGGNTSSLRESGLFAKNVAAGSLIEVYFSIVSQIGTFGINPFVYP